MLIQVKDAKRINPKLFPKPDFSHIGKGNVTVSDPIFIPFEQILVPDDGQRGRVEDQPTGDRITRIKHSFAPGVRTTEFLPAVIERNVDSDEPVKYELLYGVGRTWTFAHDMGAKGYWYNKIENATDSDLEWVCLTENEELEKTPNKEYDVIQSISKMIKKGDIKPTEKAIDDGIRHNLPFRRAESRGRIIKAVCGQVGIRLRHVTYTDGTAKEWVRRHSTIEYVIGGKWDPRKKMYGYFVKEGRVKDFFHKAIMQKAETGKSSYGIFHYDLPGEGSSFAHKTQKQYDYVERMHDNYTKLGMDTRSFIHIEGSIPQDHEKHNWKVLVSWPTATLIAKALKLAA